MIAEQLNLANFRGFEQIDLKFESDVNVIAGVNGMGKSGILQALASLLSRALPALTPSTARAVSFTDDDITHGKQSLETSAIFTVARQRCHVVIQRPRTDGSEGGDTWNLLLEDIYTPDTRTGELTAVQEMTQQTLRQLRQAPNQPLVVYFSTQRFLAGRPRALPELKPFSIANAYSGALQARDVDVREFMHWFRVVESGLLDADGRQATRVLDDLRQVVTRFVPEFTDLRLEERPTLRFIVEKAGVPLVLNQLSDGERGLLAIIFDLARRLSIANPALDDPVSQGKAMVLIDEIELHLHPRWQRQVLRRFTETFKNCQFIVTTHSPQVLGEVEGRCVRFLLYEDDQIIAWTPQHAMGLDSNRILEELMDATPRNVEVEERLHTLFQLIDDENFAAAHRCIEALEEILGDNDPELTRARTLMAFLEGE